MIGTLEMKILNVLGAGDGYHCRWPDGTEDEFAWIDYLVCDPDGGHTVRIGFGERIVYAKLRKRVVVWIDDHAQVVFTGTDDFESSGSLVSELKIYQGPGLKPLRFPFEEIPDCYCEFHVTGMPEVIVAAGIHQVWAVKANIADHENMIRLAFLRRVERS